MDDMANVEDLVGKTLVSIDRGDAHLTFTTEKGEVYEMLHRQCCCESVYLDDVAGDLDDLIGSPMLTAEEAKNEPEPKAQPGADSSHTWTFYKFATIKGYVTVRWFGSSNGYYGETVDFMRLSGASEDEVPRG